MSFNALSPSSILESPPRMQRTTATATTVSPILESPMQDSRSISTQSLLTLPPINESTSLDFSVHGLSPLMGPSIPSTPTAQLLSLSSRSTDYFGRAWKGASYKLNDYAQENTKDYAPRSKELRSCSILEHSEINLGPARHEGKTKSKPKSRDSSRYQSSGNNNICSISNNRHAKPPSQKAMLSKALQKANTAVLLDNAQNFEGAIQAYSEACAFLQKVMLRGSGDDDRRKLEAICNTYTTRINELENTPNMLTDNGKALPARPESDFQKNLKNFEMVETDDEEIVDEEDEEITEDEEYGEDEDHYIHEEIKEDSLENKRKSLSGILNDKADSEDQEQNRSMHTSQLPPRRESLLQLGHDSASIRLEPYKARLHTSLSKEIISSHEILLESPKILSLLSSQASALSRTTENNICIDGTKSPTEEIWPDTINSSNLSGHSRLLSNDSMSWVEKIDELESSTALPARREVSALRVGGKFAHTLSSETEAEFDAALDAAVKAAYNDGFMPIDYNDNDAMGNLKRRVELAKSKARPMGATSGKSAHTLEHTHLEPFHSPSCGTEEENDVNELEEEEEIFDEIRDYAMDEFEFGIQSKSTLPRESDSSGFSGRTWNSSIGSNPTTAGTILSTVSEDFLSDGLPSPSSNNPADTPTSPQPSQTILEPSQSYFESSSIFKPRRLSGHSFNAQLIPENNTSAITNQFESQIIESQARSCNNASALQSKATGLNHAQQVTNNSAGLSPKSRLPIQPSSSHPDPNASDLITCLPTVPPPNSSTNPENSFYRPLSPSPAISRSTLRKKISSSSLRNFKSRNNTISTVDDGSDTTPSTPSSLHHNIRNEGNQIHHLMPGLTTLNTTASRDKQNGMHTGNIVPHSHEISGNESPGPSSFLESGPPMSLEPCPTEYLLRPFWLMRALYQTLTHPKGGYISSKLFIPSDVWRVKGVKIKNVEEKIINCETITAALTKLARIDKVDADAVLEEMQALEIVLEQAQASLTKKLGSEVGVQNFSIPGGPKDNSNDCDNESTGGTHKSGNSSTKSSFSWRRLRSKNSGVGLSHTYSTKSTQESVKESFTIASLPMASSSSPRTRFIRKDVSQTQFSGPNSNYMSALARLFDAAQIVDQIARQVDDPGLRHADKTQVGLELCTRHSAEFFGFYICRFVLTDVALLMDKFIKKGGEWVLV